MRPEGAATKKWMQPGRGRSIVTTRTTLGLSSAADQRGPWNMKFALQLKKPASNLEASKATQQQQQQLNHHIHQDNVSLCSRSRFYCPPFSSSNPRGPTPTDITVCAIRHPGLDSTGQRLFGDHQDSTRGLESLDKRSTGPLSPRDEWPTPASKRGTTTNSPNHKQRNPPSS